jgi:erythronate-4-phosphate dehydrogenase
MKIVADDKIPFLKGVLEPFCDVCYKKGSDITKEDLLDAQALITRTRTHCTQQLLEDTDIQFIATATIGYDHIDTGYCDKKGIKWTNAPGCNSGSVYQYLASVLVTISAKYKLDFSNMALGVVGVGNVGKKVVRLGEILGAQVYLNDPPRQRSEGTCGFVSLDGIIRECNIITLHTPLQKNGTDKTFHLIDENFLRKLHPDTILINSSRGEVIDNKALKKALKEKWIRGGILDVWETEPDVDEELLDLLDIATPHIAGYSTDGKANGTAMSVQALSKYFNLPLKDWVPEDLPIPSREVFTLDCKDKSDQAILSEAIFNTYSVLDDDKKLRSSVSTFENQRGSYPLRREFQAYQLILKHETETVRRKLINLGFNVL